MLSNLTKIEEAVKARPEELARARQGGHKVVGYFCSYIPEEIIHALGLIPLRLEYGGDEYLVEVGGRYISKNNCVFIRGMMGLFLEGKDPFVKNSDMLAVATSCLQIYRLAEVVNYFLGVPYEVLGVPRCFYLPEAKEYFQKEVENFTRKLEAFAGKKLDEGALRESMGLYREIRKTASEIYRFQAQDPAPINWRDVFSIIQAGFCLDKEYYLSCLQGLLAELKSPKEMPPQSDNTAMAEKPRILLSGTIIPRGDNKLIDIIAEMGGRIVADDLCTGLRFITDVEAKDFSLAGIADAYLDKIPCASLPYPFPLETDRRLANLAHLIEVYRVEGIIYHTLRYCDPFTFKALETKNFFADKVAFMEIHTEYARSDIMSVKTRVEAFMELIHNLRLGKKRTLVK